MVTLLREVIDRTGLARRKAFDAIREGRISQDGVRVFDPSRDYSGGLLTLDGRPLAAVQNEHVYLMLNKPTGFISSRADELSRRTVLDLVPPAMRAPGLHPVGRLDQNTTGLLLLTNDGDFTYHLTHPSHEMEKEYWVGLASPAYDHLLAALREGVELDGALRVPVRVERLQGEEPFHLSLTIAEGRKRQVRRMFLELGVRVTHLRRVREGSLTLGDLAEGRVRYLTKDEVEDLLRPSLSRGE